MVPCGCQCCGKSWREKQPTGAPHTSPGGRTTGQAVKGQVEPPGVPAAEGVAAVAVASGTHRRSGLCCCDRPKLPRAPGRSLRPHGANPVPPSSPNGSPADSDPRPAALLPSADSPPPPTQTLTIRVTTPQPGSPFPAPPDQPRPPDTSWAPRTPMCSDRPQTPCLPAPPVTTRLTL